MEFLGSSLIDNLVVLQEYKAFLISLGRERVRQGIKPLYGYYTEHFAEILAREALDEALKTKANQLEEFSLRETYLSIIQNKIDEYRRPKAFGPWKVPPPLAYGPWVGRRLWVWLHKTFGNKTL